MNLQILQEINSDFLKKCKWTLAKEQRWKKRGTLPASEEQSSFSKVKDENHKLRGRRYLDKKWEDEKFIEEEVFLRHSRWNGELNEERFHQSKLGNSVFTKSESLI